jgi:hypothetical protein
VGEVGDRPDVEEPQARIARQLAVQETGVLVDVSLPRVEVRRILDPAALDVALLRQADLEKLERAPVTLGRGHEVARLGHVVDAVHHKGLEGGHDGRHAGRGGAALGVVGAAVSFQQRQRPFVVVGGGVGDARVAPGGDEVRKGRRHLVRVAVRLGRAHEDRLDDRALVVLDGVLHRVHAVHGDRVELPLLDDVRDVLVALGEICVVPVDVLLHTRRDVDLVGGGHL